MGIARKPRKPWERRRFVTLRMGTLDSQERHQSQIMSEKDNGINLHVNTGMENPSGQSSPHRIAFYPCCAEDIEEPRHFLAPYVDEILFCDLKKPKAWNNFRDEPDLPVATFLQGDVRELIATLPLLFVLFYRNDSSGEGGSSQHIVGKELLPKILSRFDRCGGWIFTDGANSNGGKTLKKLLGADGYGKPSWGFHMRRVDGCNLRNRLDAPVHAIEVSPLPPVKPQVHMRPGWVPPRDYTFDSLDEYMENLFWLFSLIPHCYGFQILA
jgi:hypothetical protein